MKLSDEKIQKANLMKNELLIFLNNNGVKYPLNNLSKPYIGTLSPGCLTCINGTWSCIYINRLCTRNCFYCPQDRSEKEERLPNTDEHLFFNSVKEYINYLGKFHFEGIGFSGGEPFIVFDKLIEYIKEIRRVFGSKHYLWIYTNGDLVTEKRLKQFHKAGLNELRFDIAANNYDLKSVVSAVKHIDTVTIEIPAIPEDLKIVKSSLKEFDKIGVKHLNIHQLHMNKHNRTEFANRNYSITNANLYKNGLPVIESELTAFEILKHAINIESKMGVNYCSRCYKARFQGKAHRERYASLCKPKAYSVTKSGYMRKLSIHASKGDLNLFQDFFNQIGRPECELTKEDDKEILVFPSQYLEKLLATGRYKPIDITYYRPDIKPLNKKNTGETQTLIFGTIRISLNKDKVFHFKLKNKTSAMFFQKLFIENKEPDQMVMGVLELYGLNKKKKEDILGDIISFYEQFEELEYISKEMPDYD